MLSFVGVVTAVTCAIVGDNVSIHVTVTVLAIELSPSVIVILNVSLHVTFAFGVYVTLSHPILIVHLLPLAPVAVILSQLPAAAADKLFQLNSFAPLQIFVQYVKLFAVTAIFVRVHVDIVHIHHNHCTSYAL